MKAQRGLYSKWCLLEQYDAGSRSRVLPGVKRMVRRQSDTGKRHFNLEHSDDPGEVPVHTGMVHGVQWRAAL